MMKVPKEFHIDIIPNGIYYGKISGDKLSFEINNGEVFHVIMDRKIRGTFSVKVKVENGELIMKENDFDVENAVYEIGLVLYDNYKEIENSRLTDNFIYDRLS